MQHVENNTVLNYLGCVTSLLNGQIELADEAMNIKKFNILKNIPVEIDDQFIPDSDWDVQVFNCYEEQDYSRFHGSYAFSVVGGKTKELVHAAFKKLINMENEQFLNLIHPTAYVSRSAHLDYGLQVDPLTSIGACSSLGFGVNIRRNSGVAHHCVIDDYVTLNAGVTLSSFVHVGKYTEIGSGAVVKDNITIGADSIIGAGSVVVRDIPPNSVAYGNPCRVHRAKD